jgi:hypothetical protein
MFETSFKSFFGEASEQFFLREQAEGGVLQHLTHLEELILTTKDQGLKIAISFLKELYETLKGKTDSKTFVSVKFDGAPSIIAGINPENEQFFVSTKSLGNVSPKINYTDQDVDRNHGHAPGLAKKLKLALKYFPLVIREGIYQGDFMFDQEDLKQQTVDNQPLITFKPNTITYAVEQNSALGQQIRNAKVGVIFHTKYSGKNLQSLTKSSNVSVSEFSHSQDVFVDDAKFKDVSGIATFTKEETDKFDSLIDSIEVAGNRIAWHNIPDNVYSNLNTFINSLIRGGRFIKGVDSEYENFINWVTQKGEKTVSQLKTESGRRKKQEALNVFLQTIESNKNDIFNLLNLSKKLEQAKMIFVNKYNSAVKTKQFLTQPDGTLKATAPEGYVAVDHIGNMVKFVSRLDFSAANFAMTKGEKFK